MVVEDIVGLLDAPLQGLLGDYFIHPGLLFLLPVGWAIITFAYTIRSHPKLLSIPSLQFVMSQLERNSPKRFFSSLPINLLLIIHLLIFTLIATAAAQPFLLLPKSQASQEVIILVDISQSMQTADRFDQAIDLAKGFLSSSNTIIAIADKPILLAEDVNIITARSLLDTVTVTDTTTAIHAAMQYAIDLGPENAAVHLISDGVATVNTVASFESLVAQLEAAQNSVYVHTVNQGSNNVGIIDANIQQNITTLTVRNYNTFEVTTSVEIGGTTNQIVIPAQQVTQVDVPTPLGPAEVTLGIDDELKADNTLYLAAPEEKSASILYITNRPDPFLQLALSLMDFVDVTIDNPPGENVGQYDMYILDEVDPKLLLPSTIPEIQQNVRAGSGLIIKMSPEMTQLDWLDLLNVIPSGVVDSKEVNVIPGPYTEDIAISSVQNILSASAKQGAQVLAYADEIPVFTRNKVGTGTVYYYGMQQETGFVYEFGFPLLFKQWIQDSLNKKELTEVHVKTGDVIGEIGSDVVLPDGSQSEGRQATQVTGHYGIDGVTYAVNTLSSKESDIRGSSLDATRGFITQGSATDNKAPYPLWNILVAIAFVLLLTEFAIVKWRGDM